MNDLLRWYAWPWQRYAQFSGRSSRKEFWTFYLGNLLIVLTLSSLIQSPARTLLIVFALAVFVPTLAVMVRRLHDQGRRGWWVLLGFIPAIGGLVVLVLMAFDGQPGDNAYGPDPKGVPPEGA